MRRQSVLRTLRCQESSWCCGRRFRSKPSPPCTHGRIPSRQFGSTGPYPRLDNSGVAAETGENAADAGSNGSVESKPSSGFGKGWGAGPTFKKTSTLTPEEMKMRDALIAEREAQEREARARRELVRSRFRTANPYSWSAAPGPAGVVPQNPLPHGQVNQTGGGFAGTPVNVSRNRDNSWYCPACHFLNYSRRSDCHKCGHVPQLAPESNSRTKPISVTRNLDGSWNCPVCQYLNFRRREDCRGCSTKPDHISPLLHWRQPPHPVMPSGPKPLGGDNTQERSQSKVQNLTQASDANPSPVANAGTQERKIGSMASSAWNAPRFEAKPVETTTKGDSQSFSQKKAQDVWSALLPDKTATAESMQGSNPQPEKDRKPAESHHSASNDPQFDPQVTQPPREFEPAAYSVPKLTTFYQTDKRSGLKPEKEPTVQAVSEHQVEELLEDADDLLEELEEPKSTEQMRDFKADNKKLRKQRRQQKNRYIRDEDGIMGSRDYDDYDDLDLDEFEAPRRKKKGKKEKKDKSLKAEDSERVPIYLPDFISVGNLADALSIRKSDFLETVRAMGFEEATYDHVLDAETAGLIATEFNFEPMFDKAEDDLVAAPEPEDPSKLVPRPPIVTIMGHVDHGKTTILDYLRKSSVAASEHGGITQHIGAFSVSMPSGKTITFLDTPGHAAFLDMRRRGANITDIIILVVAADDSVKPQTVEAIKHAKEANVPLIVAINKIDKPDINVEKVKQDLARHSVNVEDYGGDVQAVCVSGKTGQGMLELEEATIALSEMLDHRADPHGNAEGWIIEAATKKGGRVATVLVRRGTLRPGDVVVAGKTWARIRSLRNEAGAQVKEAPPGTPVAVDGWREQPVPGDEVIQAPSEQRAKEVVEMRLEKEETQKTGSDMMAINEARRAEREKREQEQQQELLAEQGIVTEPETHEESNSKAIPVIIKADVSGSVEAIVNAVSSIGNNEVYPTILRTGVGPVGEFDINHAAVAKGMIVTFNQPAEPEMTKLAQAEGVKILNHTIIYELIDDVKAKLSEHLPPIITTRVLGEAEIAQIFEITLKRRQKAFIAGCRVTNGLIGRNHKVRVFRGDEMIYDGSLASLKNVKKDVTEMRKGTECGLSFENWTGFQVGDTLQTYEEIQEKRYL
ncbi:hypothetical protein VTO42DRAFT_3173 [Malbranchea cinnamomea]